MKKFILTILIFTLIFTLKAYAAEDNYIENALSKMNFTELQQFIEKNNEYFDSKNLNISETIKNIVTGKFTFNFIDYFKFVLNKEKCFFKIITKNCINILIISVILTIINYFSIGNNHKGSSEIVFTISIMIIFMLLIKDLNSIKFIVKEACIEIEEISTKLNSLFITVMITFGKLSIMQFFQSYSNYIINLTTKVIYSIMDYATFILIVIIIINNINDLLNIKLFYKFIKKAVLVFVSLYISIVVINFSVQGYILSKTDSVFMSSIMAISPKSIPLIGNAVNSFMGVFLKSLLLIKDIVGVIFIIFILSAFGDIIIKILFVFLAYKVTAVIVEPFNEKISRFINEVSDVFYIYLICFTTPILIITIYYSIILNYLNNVFG